MTQIKQMNAGRSEGYLMNDRDIRRASLQNHPVIIIKEPLKSS